MMFRYKQWIVFLSISWLFWLSSAHASRCDLNSSHPHAASEFGAQLNSALALPSKESCSIFENEFIAPVFEGMRDTSVFLSTRVSMDGKPFDHLLQWGSIVTGSDLARTYLRELPDQSELQNPALGVIDSSFELANLPYDRIAIDPQEDWTRSLHRTFFVDSESHHGTQVINVITNRAPFGSAERGTVKALASTYKQSEIKDAFRFMAKKDIHLINISMEWPDLGDKFFDDYGGKRILVAAAGNDHPSPMQNDKTHASFISVGAIDWGGKIAKSSQESRSVVIAAPNMCPLTYHSGNKTQATGTSCSAPMVTGSLANVLAILPDLTPFQAKALLRSTALHTLNSRQKPQMNGAGMLNSYKLVRVAQRLKEKLKADEWAAKDSLLALQELLEQPSTFDFSEEAKTLYATGVKLLSSNDCTQKREGEKRIRASFMLNENEPAREILQNLFTAQGYPGLAKFFSTFDPSLTPSSIRSD